jgi:hypothetical protein
MGSIHIKKSIVPFIELGFGIYMLGCITMCLHFGTAPMSVPFLVLFALGYFYVSFSSFHLQYQMNQQVKQYNEQLELESMNAGTTEQQLLPALENASMTIPSNTQTTSAKVKKI